MKWLDQSLQFSEQLVVSNGPQDRSLGIDVADKKEQMGWCDWIINS